MTADRPLPGYEPAADLPAHLRHADRCTAKDCRAVLLPGFDPPGDRCRHHADKRPRDREEHAA